MSSYLSDYAIKVFRIIQSKLTNLQNDITKYSYSDIRMSFRILNKYHRQFTESHDLTDQLYEKYKKTAGVDVLSKDNANEYIRQLCIGMLTNLFGSDMQTNILIGVVNKLVFMPPATQIDCYILYTKAMSAYYSISRLDVWHDLIDFIGPVSHDMEYAANKLKISPLCIDIRGTILEQYRKTDTLYHFNFATKRSNVNIYLYCDLLLLNEYNMDVIKNLMLLDIHYFRNGKSEVYSYIFPDAANLYWDDIRGWQV
jgi:hypothetical protein